MIITRWSWALVGILVVYGVVFARAASFDYVWDDVATIKESQQFDRPLRESILVTQNGHISPELVHLQGLRPTHESYRPFLFLTFKLDFELFGKSSAAMHVHNLIDGALAILLAYALARRLAGRLVATFVAAVFALHPLHVEPFAYLSARADSLSGLLALASALCIVETEDEKTGEPRPRRTRIVLGVAASVAFLLSLFTKEASIGLPIAIGVFGVALGRARAWMWPLFGLCVTVLISMVIRRVVAPGGVPVAPLHDIWQGVIDLPGLTFEYFALTIAPIAMSIARPLDRAWITFGLVVFAAIALLAVIPMTRRRVLRLDTSDGRLIIAGLLWGVILIGPASIGVVLFKTVADRYAFLPLFGFALALGIALEASAHRVVAAIVTGAWLAITAAVSLVLVPSWANETALYTYTSDVEPESALAHHRLGSIYTQQQRWDKAVLELEKATVLEPANHVSFNNLGVSYMNLGRYDDAERAFRQANALMGGLNFRAWYNLGTLHRLRGDIPRACKSFSKALAINPGYRKATEDANRYCISSPPK